MDVTCLKSELFRLLLEKSVCRGTFVLSSGATSDLYVDAKLTTLDPRGAFLVGQIGWEIIKQTRSRLHVNVHAIGGLTMGADPIALSIGVAAYLESMKDEIQTFTVRKAAKEHGRRKQIEGNFSPGEYVVIVDDVVTTGGSTIQAIEAVEKAGGHIAFVLVLVDREEGGKQNIEQRGLEVVPIFTRSDIVGPNVTTRQFTETVPVA